MMNYPWLLMIEISPQRAVDWFFGTESEMIKEVNKRYPGCKWIACPQDDNVRLVKQDEDI